MVSLLVSLLECIDLQSEESGIEVERSGEWEHCLLTCTKIPYAFP
jgi:hypothetical protein